MKIRTSRFGELDIDEARIISFAEGILGFSQHRKYALLEHEANTPFRWLQSVENGELAFVVIDPLTVVPDYKAEVKPEDIEDISIKTLDSAVVFCIVNIARGCRSVTVNLLSPIVINTEKMLARQVILFNSLYSIKHDLAAPSEIKKAAAAT